MKMKVSGEWTEQKDGGNTHRKYAIRGIKRNLPYAVAVDVSVSGVLLLFCLCVDCFKISAEQKWNWRLAENEGGK